MSRTDLTCNETMPITDEQLDARNQAYRPPGGYGGPSTSQARFPHQLPKPQASRALYPGSLIPSISGLPHGLSLPGSAAPPAPANNAPKNTAPTPIMAANAANSALVAQREKELRLEQARKKEEEEALRKTSAVNRTTAGPSTSTAHHSGIIRPTPTMPNAFSNPMMHHAQPRMLGHDYLSTAPMIRETQVKQIPKGGGLVHAPYNPAMKNRLQEQREAASSHTIARPVARHVGEQPNAAAQFALSQAALANHEATMHRNKLLQEKRDAEARAHQQLIERERVQMSRLEEERNLRNEMGGIAPLVRPAQRGAPNQPILDPSRANRGLPSPIAQRFAQQQNMTLTQAMQFAAAQAAQNAQIQKEREDRERFERERDRLERAAAEPMHIPPVQHPSPMHIPTILQGRNNWNKSAQNTPNRPGYSPVNPTGLGTSGMPSFDHLLGLNSSPYAARLHQNLLMGGSNPAYGALGQHVSPSPSTPQVMATPSPRPSILRRKGTDTAAAKRRLGFDESNPQTVGELATAQLNSGVIGGLSDAKKIKIEAEIKKELLDYPSTSSYPNVPFNAPIPASAIKQEPFDATKIKQEPLDPPQPTPQKKRQRKQQFDANQAPEQIRMQIREPPFVPIMGMHSAQYPGEMLYYQLPPEAPKKKRGRPPSHAKEQALLEVQSFQYQQQLTTRSIIVDVDGPKIVAEKKRGGRKKKDPQTTSLSHPLLPPVSIKQEPLDDIPPTPPALAAPPRPSSSSRPKSAIYQQHIAAMQLQQQMKHELHTPPMVQTPVQAEQSPFTYAAADDFPLEFDSDEELVSAEALAAAKACAQELGLIGPDGEPRETTPVRLAREQEEAEEEEERQREMMERLNSAGLQQLQAAIRKKEEMERKEAEEEEQEEREALERQENEMRAVDRRLRFLSHDESIIARFFQKVREQRESSSESEESESGDDEEEEVEDEEKEEEESESSEVAVSDAEAEESGESEESGDSEGSVDVDEEEPSKMDDDVVDESENDEEEKLFTLTEEQLERLKERGDDFTVVEEVERNDETWKAAEAAEALFTDSNEEDESEEDEDEEDEEESEESEGSDEELTEEQIQEGIETQERKVKKMNAEMRLETLMKEQGELEERSATDKRLEKEIQRTLKEIDELNVQEEVADDEEEVESDEEPAAPRKELIPLDALGDRDNFVQTNKTINITVADHALTSRRTSLKSVSKNRYVKKAFDFIKSWKRDHSSGEETRGVVLEEPIDVAGDLMRASKRDKMIERTFNQMKKKVEHDRLREKMREEIIEKRIIENKRIQDELNDDDTKIVEKMMEEIVETIEKDSIIEKVKEDEDILKEEDKKKDEESSTDTMVEEDVKEVIKVEEKIDDVNKEEAEKVADLEMKACEKDAEEEDVEDGIDLIERARIQKENDEILRMAIAEVDAKIAKRENVPKKLRSYFSVPQGRSQDDSDLVEALCSINERQQEEELCSEELEKLLQTLDVSEEDDEEDEEDEDEESEDSEAVEDEEEEEVETETEEEVKVEESAPEEPKNVKETRVWRPVEEIGFSDEKSHKLMKKDAKKMKETKEKESGKVEDEEEADVEEDSEDDGEEIPEEFRVSSNVVKITATKDSRKNVPFDEMDSLSASLHRANIVNLFGIDFAEIGDDAFMPVVSAKEREEAREAHLTALKEQTAQKVKDTLQLEERYQDEDALPRAVTRFRRCEAVDSVMMRDADKKVDEPDPELAALEAQVIGFLSKTARSTKREAFLEKQNLKLEKKKDTKARSGSPILFYKREPAKRSILGKYSIDYNPREQWAAGDDAESADAIFQHNQIVRQQFERAEEERKMKLMPIVEGIAALRDPINELPCPAKQRKEFLQDMLIEHQRTKTKSCFVDVYNGLYDDNGLELNGQSTSQSTAKKTIGRNKRSTVLDESAIVTSAKIVEYIEDNEVELDRIPTVAGKARQDSEEAEEWFDHLKELDIDSEEEDDDDEEESEEDAPMMEKEGGVIDKDCKAADETENPIEGGHQDEQDDSDEDEMLVESPFPCPFDLEHIKKVYHSEEEEDEEGTEGVKVSLNALLHDTDEEDSDDSEEMDDELGTSDDDIEEEKEEEKVEDEVVEKELEETEQSETAAIAATAVLEVPEEVKEVEEMKEGEPSTTVPADEATVKIEVEDHCENVRSYMTGRDDVKIEENGEREEEAKEEKEDPAVHYEDHVVTMTRGGKTSTHVVRRPSNATAAMKMAAKPVKSGPRQTPPRYPETRQIITKITEDGRIVHYVKSNKKRRVVKKPVKSEEEQYREFCEKTNTRFVVLPDENVFTHDDEEEMESEINRIEGQKKLFKQIRKRQSKYEVTEEEKLEIGEEIEEELDEEEYVAPSADDLNTEIKEETTEDPAIVASTNEISSDAEKEDSSSEEEIDDEMEEEMEEISDDEFEQDSDLAELDEETNPNYYLAGNSSCSEDDDDDEYDASGLKPFKNAKVIDTTVEGRTFPWLCKVDKYDEIVLSKHAKKLAGMREKLKEDMKKKKNALRFRKKALPRYKLNLPKKKSYVSPFHSLYSEELPEQLLNDLNIIKMIMETSLSDDTITAAELVALRKKVNLTKRGFATVIKRKSLKPPKAFKDLIRFAIQRGEKSAKQAATIKSITKWQRKFESGKMGRAKRKAILKQVKVTRQKLNARHGHKFHRTQWTLKSELEKRWKKEHKLPRKKPLPRMGNKQFLQELRRLKELRKERLEKNGGKMEHDERAKQAQLEREKQARRAEKGKTSALHRMASGLSFVSQEAHEAEIRTRGQFAGNLIMYDRATEEFEFSASEEEEEVAEPGEEAVEGESETEESEDEDDDERDRRERSYTYETVKNSSDDESFVDYGHVHKIGPQVFPNSNVSCPTSPGEFCNNAPALVFRDNAFQGVEVQSSLVTVEQTPMKTPPKPEMQPRPFLTLAQRKCYFTEETEEQKRKKEEEAARKKEEEERIEREKKEEEERLEKLRIEEEERIAAEKREEELKVIAALRLKEEKRREEARLKKEREAKLDEKYAGIRDQIDEDTWDKQLKMIIDRTMRAFRRSEAVQFLVASCEEMDCEESIIMRAIDEWEEEQEEERITEGSLEYMPITDLFEAEPMAILRKGMKVEKMKKDAIANVPVEIQIEDLMDTMCTFITAHLEDVTMLSESRMTSEHDLDRLRILPPAPKKFEGALLNKSIAAIVNEDELEMLAKALGSTENNKLSVVGTTSSGAVFTSKEVKDHPLLDKVDYDNEEDSESDNEDEEDLKSDESESDDEIIDLLDRAGVSIEDDMDDLQEVLLDDVIKRSLDSPDLRGALDCEEPSPVPTSCDIFNFEIKKGNHAVDGRKSVTGQLKSDHTSSDSEIKQEEIEGEMDVKDEKPDMDLMRMPAIDNKKLQVHFLKLRSAIDSVRIEMKEKIGEVVDDEMLDQYLREHVWTDEGNSYNIRMMLEDLKKQKEREQRSRIAMNDVPALAVELSVSGQFDRLMHHVFYISPFSKEGSKIAFEMAHRDDATLHCQLVLRNDKEEEMDENDDEEIRRIHPEIVMKWTEDEHKKSEVVHTFPPVPAVEWDNIQNLIRLVRQERQQHGDSDEEEERTVLLEEENDGEGVVLVEQKRWNTDQTAIADTIRFIDLELRHAVRLIKHQSVGFGNRDAVVVWRDITTRATNAGRHPKKTVKQTKIKVRTITRDRRKAIRHKAMLNSIKQTEGITKRRIEMIGDRLREKELCRARGAVSKQRRLLRSHYKRKILAEMRDYNDKIVKVNALRRERNEKRLARLQILLPEEEEFTEDPVTVSIGENSAKAIESSVETPVEASAETPVDAAIEATLFDNTLVKTEINEDGTATFGTLTDNPDLVPIAIPTPAVPAEPIIPSGFIGPIVPIIPSSNTVPMESIVPSESFAPEAPIIQAEAIDPAEPIEKIYPVSIEEEEDIKPDVEELQEQMATERKRANDHKAATMKEVDTLEKDPEVTYEIALGISDEDALLSDDDDSEEEGEEHQAIVDHPNLITESVEDDDWKEEDLLQEISATPHPLRRNLKTLEELSRPLNEREMQVLEVLKEKRAKGASLMSIDDLIVKKKKKPAFTPVYARPEIELINDGTVPEMRILIRKIKREEGQTDEEADERYVDVYYDVQGHLKDQEEEIKKSLRIQNIATIQLDTNSEDDEEEEDIDLECVLFQSYPERVRRAIVKAMNKREERIQLATRRFELYRKRDLRLQRKEWEAGELAELKKMMEEDRKEEEGAVGEDEVKKENELPTEPTREDEKDKEETTAEKVDEKMEEDKEKSETSEKKKEDEKKVDESGEKLYYRHEIPPGYCPRWMKKTIDGVPVIVRTNIYRRAKRRAKLRHSRVIIGRCRGRKNALTKLLYVMDGPKSKELIEAEKEAEIAKENANNIEVDVDPAHLTLTKEVLSDFVKHQVQSDEVRLEEKAKLIDEHDQTIVKKGGQFRKVGIMAMSKEADVLEKIIEEEKHDQAALLTFKDAVKEMQAKALEKIESDPLSQLEIELAEAVDNERRILQDFLKFIQTMDTVRFQELAKLWTFDIESSDDEETVEEKRWARVRQFVLQKPKGGLKNWETKNAYVDEWEDGSDAPSEKRIKMAMGPLDPNFKGEPRKKRQGYYINDQGLPVKPRKPRHFEPLESDPEWFYNSEIDEMCHPDVNERLKDHLVKRKRAADQWNADFATRQEVVRRRGTKRKMETLRKHKKNEKNMPPLEAGLQKVYIQKSVFDAMPVTESFWTHQRRIDPEMDALLKKRLENTRELFAAVVQPLYRTVLLLRETRNRLIYHIETKDLDSDDEAMKKYQDSDDSESEADIEPDEEQPTYVLRKRPRLCQIQADDEGEDGDDEDEDDEIFDRVSRASRATSRSDSEREDSPSDDEDDSDDPDIIIEEQPKKPKKPTLFNRVIKRELMSSPDFDLSKVKEEVEQDDPEDSPAVIDITPKRRPQVRKNRGRPRKSQGSGRSDSESPLYEAPPTSLRRATGKRPLISDRATVDFYDEDEQIRLAIEESLKDQPSTSSGTF